MSYIDAAGSKKRAPKYGGIAILAHWTLAVMALSLAAVGFLLSWQKFPSEAYNNLHYWHRSFGEVALIIVVFALVWRKRNPPPPRIESSNLRRVTAIWTQSGIYVLLLAMPLLKIARGAFGLGWVFFGLSVPALWPPNKAFRAIALRAESVGVAPRPVL